MRRAAALSLLLLFAACRQSVVTRAEWQRMDLREKTAVVRSFAGHHHAVSRKGGTPASEPAGSPQEWVAAVDRKYAAGDDRSVEQIWDEMRRERRPNS